MVLSFTAARAQLYNYTTDLGGAPASVAANTSGTSLIRVNTAQAITGCPDGFNSNRFSESTTFLASRPAVEFSISPNSGYQLNITSLSVDARRNTKGPVTWRLAYSVDGGASWINNGSDYSVTVTSCGSANTLTWDIPDFSVPYTVYVRVYAYGALSNLNGIATMKNIVLSGSTSFADVDADGYTSNVDCDDFNAAVNTGATEVCNEIDDNCDGNIDEGVQTTFYADADGDGYGDAGNTTLACSVPAGYVTDATDCNDADAGVNPGASEVCNGIDDNCDGNADEGLPFDTWYADADGDTYGDPGNSVSTCDGAPSGYVADASDCDDNVASINPGASETCNGIDDDCNGMVDDGLTFDTWYADADGDGYGDAGSTTMACSAPAGYVADATDCNDADGAINPGATEVCNGIDDNCDGNTDEGVLITFYADADGDTYGDAAVSTDACSAPGGYVANSGDCNDASNTVYPGAAEICANGIDEDCDGVVDLPATIAAGGPTSICLGSSVTLTCTTGGTGLSYQWQKNGNPIAGATGVSYVATLQGNYRCVVSKPSCSATSSPITVTVLLNPSANITTPDGLDLCGKAYVRLKANTGAGLTYQWYKDGNAIGGATAVTYFATATGAYYVRVTNANGCSTNSATVNVFSSCRMAEGALAGDVNIMPNPSNGKFTINFTTAQAMDASAQVSILNLAGQQVAAFEGQLIGGQMTAGVDIAPVAGAYVVVINVNGVIFTEKLMIAE